jgi:DNA-binding response OmpR family regulator
LSLKIDRSQNGYDVQTAADAEQALELLKAFVPA